MVIETIQLRRDTAANWAGVNPVLAQGEAGVETDTGKAKLGNGATAWASLPYWNPSGASGGGSVSSVFGRTGVVSATAGDYAVAQVTGAAAVPSGTASAGRVPVATGAGQASAWTPIGVPLKSGWFYPQDGGGGTMTLIYNQLWLFPFDCQRAITLAQLALNVKSAGSAGTAIRMAVYASDGAGGIGNLVLDPGTVTGAATGVQSLTGLATPAGPDRLWLGAVWQGTNSTAPQVQGYGRPLPFLGWSSYNQFPSVIAYQFTGITGALPASLAAPAGYENNLAPGVQFAPQ